MKSYFKLPVLIFFFYFLCTTPLEVDSSVTPVKRIDPKTGDTILTQERYFQCDAPSWLLTYFGIGDGIALMKYYTAGCAKMEHILIFKFTNNDVIDFWKGNGNLFKDDATQVEIMNYLQTYMNNKKVLNSNTIYL